VVRDEERLARTLDFYCLCWKQRREKRMVQEICWKEVVFEIQKCEKDEEFFEGSGRRKQRG
jgi:hypothetical protein